MKIDKTCIGFVTEPNKKTPNIMQKINFENYM